MMTPYMWIGGPVLKPPGLMPVTRLLLSQMTAAKTDLEGINRKAGGGSWNSLLAHAIDAACCAGELWDRYLARNMITLLAEAFGAGDPDLARRIVMLLAGAHDLGKASDVHQHLFGTGAGNRRDLAKERQIWEPWARANGLPLAADLAAARRAHHAHITAAALPRLLGCPGHNCGGNGACNEALHAVALLLGGHHGHIPNDAEMNLAVAADSAAWTPVHAELLAHLAEHLDVDLTALPGLLRLERPSVLPLFAGLVVHADWLASDEYSFPYRCLEQPVEQWWSDARHQAQAAVTRLRLDRWEPIGTAWEQLFPDTPTPRPFQRVALDAVPPAGPALVVVESDTGSGKTRLALAIAHHLARTNGYHGLYLALPNRAATAQATSEIAAFIAHTTGRASNLAVACSAAEATPAVHALLDAAERLTAPTDIDPASDTESCGKAVLDPWFLRRCLGLVSPFGAGTVDQITLAPQGSRHWFLRLYALAGKTVIIDEAHAYELFQEQLLGTAISWLADAGASVVLLSATLPEATRTALIQAWCEGRRTAAGVPQCTGPITVVDGQGEVHRVHPPKPPTPLHTTMVLQQDPGPTQLARHLLASAKDGGVVAVIRNRTVPAIVLHAKLVKHAKEFGWSPDEIVLLHGKLLGRDRHPVEGRLSKQAGPNGEDRTQPNPRRPKRLITVGTQVLEQSLDLDYDHIITDLAPIDLLIQRRGREHRHAVNNPHRMPQWQLPRLTVLWRPDEHGLPLVEPADPPKAGNADGLVYAPYILAATWHLLIDLTSRPRCEDCRRFADKADGSVVCLTTPADSAKLLDRVYGQPHPASGALPQLLQRTQEAWAAELANEAHEASSRALPPFWHRRGARVPISAASLAHSGDGVRARSRLGSESTTIVLAYQHGKTLTWDPQGEIPVSTTRLDPVRDKELYREEQRQLQLNTISVPEYWFGPRALPRPETWPTRPEKLLKHQHVAVLDPATGRCVAGPANHLRYDTITGLHR